MSKHALQFFSILSTLRIAQSAYLCSNPNATFWYSTSTPSSMANISSGLCYGNFTNYTSGDSWRASKVCASFGSHLAVAYTFDEYYALISFVSKVNASLSMASLYYNQPLFKYPFWIGLRRNESYYYWNDECRNPAYQNGTFSMRDMPGQNESYALDYDGYNSLNASVLLPYFICRKDFNKCGSNPCQNGGQCTNYGQCYYCNCSSNYYGEVCQFAYNISFNTNNFYPMDTSLLMNATVAGSSQIQETSTASFPMQETSTATFQAPETSTVFGSDVETTSNAQYIATTSTNNSVSTIRVRTWRVHYLMTTTQQSSTNTTVYVPKKIFDAFNLSKTTWFAMGLAAFLGLVILIIVCNCICGPPKPKFEPFT